MTSTAATATPIASFVSGLGVIISLGFMIAAGVMNWRYGLRLGRSDEDQLLFAAIGAGVDSMKVLLPFFLWWALRNRRWISFGLSVLLIVGLMSYSVVGIAGFVDLNRSQTTGSLLASKEAMTDLQVQLDRKQQQLLALGVFEPPSVVEERLAAQRQDRRWMTSQDCSNATAKESRQFCADYHALETEKAKGLEAERLERELGQLREAITALAGVAEIDRGDPRAGIVSRVTGWELLNVQTSLSLLLVAIIELMSTFGIFLSLNHGELRGRSEAREEGQESSVRRFSNGPVPVGRTRPALSIAAPDTSEAVIVDVRKFAVECLRPQPGSITPIAVLYECYCAWCRETNSRVLDQPVFQATFLAMCKSVGFTFKCDGGAASCLDLALRPDKHVTKNSGSAGPHSG